MLRGTLRRDNDYGDRNNRIERKKQAAHERDLFEAEKQNEDIKAELSTLESQVTTLQGALTAL